MRSCDQEIYRQDPDLTREGGSIPVTLTFAEALGVNVLLLPMGRSDDGAQLVCASRIQGFIQPISFSAQQMRNWTDPISSKG